MGLCDFSAPYIIGVRLSASRCAPQRHSLWGGRRPPRFSQSVFAHAWRLRPREVLAASRSALSQYEGVPAEVTGQVLNVESDASRVGVQIYVYPERGEGNTVVVFSKAGAPALAKGLAKGDTIHVIGTIDGEIIRNNDAGQSLTLPRVAATSVTISSKASASPNPAASRAASASASASAQGPASAGPSAPARQGDLFIVTGVPATGLNVRTTPNATAARKGTCTPVMLFNWLLPQRPAGHRSRERTSPATSRSSTSRGPQRSQLRNWPSFHPRFRRGIF